MTRSNVTALTVAARNSTRSTLLSALISAILASSAAANPTGHNVVHGTADVQTNGSELLITTQGRTIIDWTNFSIDANETTRFEMQGTDLAVLNRVIGAQASQIDGSLLANGRVYLINPNGVLIGATGTINTQSFIASTRDVDNADFVAGGDLLFSGTGTAEVRNLGSITATDGDVLLFGKRVSNSGTINASQGVVALAAGDELLLAAPDSPRLLVSLDGVALDDNGIGVNNTGVIAAAQAELQAVGGNPFGLAVNAQGVIAATGVAARDGRVYLTAGGDRIAVGGSVEARNENGSGGSIWIDAGSEFSSVVNIDGTLDVSSPSTGGVVTIDATEVRLNAASEVLLSGTDQSAGSMVIGQQGWTDYIDVAEGATIEASSNGSGGGAWLEAAGVAFNGRFEARDSSGQSRLTILADDYVAFGGLADLRSLADPTLFGLVDINSEGALYIDNVGGPEEVFLDAAALQAQLEHANVWLLAGSLTELPISVLAPLSWESAAKLSLTATGDINLQGSIGGANAEIEIYSYSGNVTGSANAAITARELSLQADGDLALLGRITAPELTLRDVGGVLRLNNEANRLENVMFNRTSEAASGGVEIVDSEGGLTLYDTTMYDSNLAANGDFTVRTVGDLTLYYTFNMDVDGVVTLVAANGLFNNLSTEYADVFGSAATGLERIRVYAAGPGEIRGLTGASYQNVSYPDDPAASERVVFYYSSPGNHPGTPTDPEEPGSPNEPTDPEAPGNPSGPSGPSGPSEPSGPQNPLPSLPPSVLIENALGNSFEQLNQLANINPQLLTAINSFPAAMLPAGDPQTMAAQFMNALQSYAPTNPIAFGGAPIDIAGLAATLNNLDEIRNALSSVLQIDPSVVDGALSSILAPWSELLSQAPPEFREQAALLVTEYSANYQPISSSFSQGLQGGPAPSITSSLIGASGTLVMSGGSGLPISSPAAPQNPVELPVPSGPIASVPSGGALVAAPGTFNPGPGGVMLSGEATAVLPASDSESSMAPAEKLSNLTKAPPVLEQADEPAEKQAPTAAQQFIEKLSQTEEEKKSPEQREIEEKLAQLKAKEQKKLEEQRRLEEQKVKQLKLEEEKKLADKLKFEEQEKLKQLKLEEEKKLADKRKVEELKKLEQQKLAHQQATPASVAAQLAAIQQAIIKLAGSKKNDAMLQALTALSGALSQENLARIMANEGLEGVSMLLTKAAQQMEAIAQSTITTASVTQTIQEQPAHQMVKSTPSQPVQQPMQELTKVPPTQQPPAQQLPVLAQPTKELPAQQMPQPSQQLSKEQLLKLTQEQAAKQKQDALMQQQAMPGMAPMNSAVQISTSFAAGGR